MGPRLAALTRKQMIAAAIPTLLMIGLLAMQLITVERQRRIAARQEVRARESLDYVRERGQSLLRRGGEAIPRIGDGLARADRLVRELARTDSPEAIAEAGRLAQRLQDADLAGRVDLIAQAVTMIVDIAADIESLTREGVEVARETGSDVEVLKAETLRFQEETLNLQRELLAQFRESVAIQRETLERVRNIDERTGGVIPVATP